MPEKTLKTKTKPQSENSILKNKGKIKIIHDKQQMKEFVTSRPGL